MIKNFKWYVFYWLLNIKFSCLCCICACVCLIVFLEYIFVSKVILVKGYIYLKVWYILINCFLESKYGFLFCLSLK